MATGWTRAGPPAGVASRLWAAAICVMLAASCHLREAREPHGTADAFDAPDAAMDFFVKQRLPPGGTRLPLERLLAERDALRARERARAAGISTGAMWQPIGPGNIGGRTRALVIDPNDPSVLYAAGVAGGIFKSTDGGASWRPLDDMMLNLAVCTLAMDPTDSSVLYAGTGEGYYAADVFVRGLGIFKSVDAGATWTQLAGTVSGVPEGAFDYVNKIVISPNDPDRIYAGTRTGVWRSLDAGATWSVVLSNPQYLATLPASNGSLVGCTDLAIRADRTPDVVFAAFGTFEADGLFRTLDGGTTWQGYTPAANQGRTSIAIAPSDNDVVYLLVADNGSVNAVGQLVNVYRSVDGGDTFTGQVNFSSPTGPWLLSNLALALHCPPGGTYSQGWYDNIIAVDPADPDIVWVGGVDLFRSDDHGQNFRIAGYQQFYLEETPPPYYIHPDQHAIVFAPGYDGFSNQTMYVGNDGGLFKTTNARAATGIENCPASPDEPFPVIAWESLNNAYQVTQFYHGDSATSVDTFIGGAQDNGSNRVQDAQTPDAWKMIFGGDGGYVAIDPGNSQTVFVEYHEFPSIQKSVDGGDTFVPATSGIVDTDGVFITPFAMDQANPSVLWTGGARPWRTMNGAASWSPAGGNIPLADKISAIGIAPSNGNTVYLGFSNGLVARTSNGLAPSPTWSVHYQGLVVGGWVSSVAVDPVNPNIAYVTYSNYDVPHVFRTTDGAQTWQSIDGIGFEGVPDIPVHWIAPRPCNPEELYVGTELGVFASADGGATWQPRNGGLAHVVVESLDFKTPDTLVAFSHGRGAFLAHLTPCGFAAPGAVPDGGSVPGTPVTLAKTGSQITLSWGASCSSGGGDFAVYEGLVGDFTSHLPVACSTGGATSLTFTPASGGRYYLAVPRNDDLEGSYGTDGSGGRRAASAAACAPQDLAGCP